MVLFQTESMNYLISQIAKVFQFVLIFSYKGGHWVSSLGNSLHFFYKGHVYIQSQHYLKKLINMIEVGKKGIWITYGMSHSYLLENKEKNIS